jgi:hypothetical protein
METRIPFRPAAVFVASFVAGTAVAIVLFAHKNVPRLSSVVRSQLRSYHPRRSTVDLMAVLALFEVRACTLACAVRPPH